MRPSISAASVRRVSAERKGGRGQTGLGEGEKSATRVDRKLYRGMARSEPSADGRDVFVDLGGGGRKHMDGGETVGAGRERVKRFRHDGPGRAERDEEDGH